MISPFDLPDVGLTALRQRNRGGFHAFGQFGESRSILSLSVYLTNHFARSVRPGYLCCI